MVSDSDPTSRDPRRLRGLMERAALLAREHQVPSVFVGIAGSEGDRLIREFISFVESALRVEDAIFCLTRERAVLLLADVDENGAEAILNRVTSEFEGRFATSSPLPVSICCYEVRPGGNHPTAKHILPEIFGGGPTPEAS